MHAWVFAEINKSLVVALVLQPHNPESSCHPHNAKQPPPRTARVRSRIIVNARIETVGKYQLCMVSKLPIRYIWKLRRSYIALCSVLLLLLRIHNVTETNRLCPYLLDIVATYIHDANVGHPLLQSWTMLLLPRC